MTTTLTRQQNLHTKLKGLKTVEDLSGFLTTLIGPAVESIFQAQIAKLHAQDAVIDAPATLPPRRGRRPKDARAALRDTGVRHDRQAPGLQPLTIRKYETIDDAMEEKVVALYAKGMTNRQFRKVTKTSQVFPHDDALLKLLWLAQHDIARKWTSAIHNWGEIMTQLGILFPEKISL